MKHLLLTALVAATMSAATLGKILEIQAKAESDRRHIMTTINELLRDAKAHKAYA